MRTKKKYGQHFLVDNQVTEAIATEIKKFSDFKNLIEVGPGAGALSKHLINSFENYIAVEIDDEVIPILKQNVPGFNKIIHEDFLEIDLSTVFDNEPFVLTGNYPYNISTQIVFKMLENSWQIPIMVGMFQKEVAHRIIAEPGSKVYGVTSVLTQLEYDGFLIMDIGPEAFEPPPRVDSSVICLQKHDRNEGYPHKALFYKVVKQAFGQRRKMLKNTLKSYFDNTETLNKAIFEKRPEHLSVNEFIHIIELINTDKNES